MARFGKTELFPHQTSMPVDQPILLRPGVMHRESDYQGNAKYYALPPEDPERTAKGDLGTLGLPEPEYSAEGGPGASPFGPLSQHK